MTVQKTLSISIILPTLNEGQRIGACLDRLLLHRRSSENLANISEILVVDGGSTDQTLEEIAAGASASNCFILRPVAANSSTVGQQRLLEISCFSCIATPSYLRRFPRISA
ncbi:MAG: glycosyltransferase [Candidatus Electrothrix sp. AS4_5]|nr:glycosyltransferase [Candidatus Electrothrix gigas]